MKGDHEKVTLALDYIAERAKLKADSDAAKPCRDAANAKQSRPTTRSFFIEYGRLA
ncbi:hypothetical protein RAS14_12895 [Achromobacter aegrifaciens]|uniref:Uncharacterized protein n=1 Tax=Achromobacter aegrifaciens TaxID=1287736 RepID=A0ABU2DN88_ACHAE|nr:hypothetical protein [Achromobacter aegrifaciens]MDQ1760654.1 hypothetical protein [Achromobacter aegrifaciens]MDR7949543.1 hypothetical protein [Achromobacter aegrifaciens]